MEIQNVSGKRAQTEKSVSMASSAGIGTSSEKTVNSDEKRKTEGSGDNIHGSMDAVNEDCIGIHTHDYEGCTEREK
ncbi:hypothetical protein V6N12_045003 [Hibiscus sabdariffa]|uniref:Uncharacterized protein n=1 Tax=Hibiscus sabdariffa TaxID=183260 RepID=A0ABR2G1H1_9ROSI